MQTFIHKGLSVTMAAVLPAVLLPVVAAAEDTVPTNAVQMVTYFPVPLARYNNIFPSKKLDIGTVLDTQPGDENDFVLTCGSQNDDCSADDTISFKANAVNLRYIAGSPALQLDTPVQTQEASFGKMNKTAQPVVKFNNLYLNGWEGGTEFEEVDAQKLRVYKAGDVKIFTKELPSCAGYVQWQQVDLGAGANKDYLVCCSSAGDDICAGSSTCTGYVTQPLTCVKNNPSGLTHTLAGQVAGKWNSTTCSCDCSQATYTATTSGQTVTGAVRQYQNALDDKDDFDYCQEKCWSDVTSGKVGTCVNSRWYNPITSNMVKINAQWNYDTCTCNCSASSDNYTNSGNGCTHKCATYYSDGTVQACKGNSAWSWVDGGGSCYCNCGNYSIYKQSGKGCVDRCVAGNPTYNTVVTNCTKTGGSWYENATGRKAACRCECGTKTQNGVTKERILNQDGTCADPAF